MITLAENQIDGVQVKLVVEETITGMGGNPTLKIGNLVVENCMVQEVDTLAVIKAVVTAKDVKDFSKKVQDCWHYDKFVVILKSFAYYTETTTVRFVEESPRNKVLVDEIDSIEKKLDNHDYGRDFERMALIARMYDLEKLLEVY